jgi:hypothetical protein
MLPCLKGKAMRAWKPEIGAPIYMPQYRPEMGTAVVPEDGPIAFLICHGMGQQVPFETLDCVAKAICDANAEQGGQADIVGRMLKVDAKENFISRVEVTLKSASGQTPQELHLYEAYWAPVTEGGITYRQTAAFLLRSGWAGLKASIQGRFDRWIFGGLKWLPVERDTFLLIALMLLILAPVLLLAGSTAIFTYVVNIVTGPKSFEFSALGLNLIIVVVIGIVWLLLRKFRNFILQYIGDVAIYVSGNEVNRFWRIREEIKDIGYQMAKTIYTSVRPPKSACAEMVDLTDVNETKIELAYRKVVVVGHSLGSVLAYDTLNTIIRNDQVLSECVYALARTEALVTLGSPLDKTAFLFRQHLKSAVVREAMANAVQPLVQSYDFRPEWWINIFNRGDIVAGSLEYYDDPGRTNEQRRVRNYEDGKRVINPASAHTGYWSRALTKEILYRAATETLNLVNEPGAKTFNTEKPKKVINQQAPHGL